MDIARTAGPGPGVRRRDGEPLATLDIVVDLARSHHHTAGLLAVSLHLGSDDHGVRLVVPGRVRVVRSEVADRLARLVDAAVVHQRGVGGSVTLDLDLLVERATADVARRHRPSGSVPPARR